MTFNDQTTPANSVGQWQWDFDDATQSFITNPTKIFPAGDHSVKLTVQNQGSFQTTTLVVHVAPPTVTPVPPTLTPATPGVTPPTRTPSRTRMPTTTPTPSHQGPQLVGYIPVVGSTAGNQGSFFKTSGRAFDDCR